MKSVYEIVYKYVLPSIKRRLAEELQFLGFTEREVARMLSISQSLISRYNKGERGALINIKLFNDIDLQVRKLAREIAENKLDSMQIYVELHKFAAYFMVKRYGCVLHTKIDGINPAKCNVCSTIFSPHIIKS
jgi:predicted transcriptional regulator